MCNFNEARAKRVKRVKRIRIEWKNVSLVVGVAIMSVAISRVSIHRECARLHQGSPDEVACRAELGQDGYVLPEEKFCSSCHSMKSNSRPRAGGGFGGWEIVSEGPFSFNGSLSVLGKLDRLRTQIRQHIVHGARASNSQAS